MNSNNQAALIIAKSNNAQAVFLLVVTEDGAVDIQCKTKKGTPRKMLLTLSQALGNIAKTLQDEATK